MEAAQAVQLTGQAGELVVIFFQPAFDKMNVLAVGVVGLNHIGYRAVHDFMGHRRAQQTGQIAFQLVAQTAQGIGAGFIQAHGQIVERQFHLPAGGAGPQGF